jgi:hypothetical protein
MNAGNALSRVFEHFWRSGAQRTNRAYASDSYPSHSDEGVEGNLSFEAELPC